MGDHQYVMACVCLNGLALEHVSLCLQADRKIALAAVSQDGSALQHASFFQNDRKFVFDAVSQRGAALEHAYTYMKADRKIVSAAVSQDGCALAHADKVLRVDPEIMQAWLRTARPRQRLRRKTALKPNSPSAVQSQKKRR